MSNISAGQFVPLSDSSDKPGATASFHVPAPHRAAEDDYAGAQDTIMDTGKERQAWSGTGRLAAPQRGALTTRERSLSYVGASGDAYGIPSPIQTDSIGSYAFKMG